MQYTHEQIDDLMVTALEGGISYWCSRAKVKDGDYRGSEYASGVISRGGTLVLKDFEQEVEYDLDATMLAKGIRMAANHNGFTFDDYDAADADNVIQYAVFGELVYG